MFRNIFLFGEINIIKLRGAGPNSEQETKAYQKFFELIEERYNTEVKGLLFIFYEKNRDKQNLNTKLINNYNKHPQKLTFQCTAILKR